MFIAVLMLCGLRVYILSPCLKRGHFNHTPRRRPTFASIPCAVNRDCFSFSTGEDNALLCDSVVDATGKDDVLLRSCFAYTTGEGNVLLRDCFCVYLW